MNIDKIRNRMAEIAQELDAIKPEEDGSYSKSQIKKVDLRNKEFDILSVQLVTAEKLASIKLLAKQSSNKKPNKTVEYTIFAKFQIQKYVTYYDEDGHSTDEFDLEDILEDDVMVQVGTFKGIENLGAACQKVLFTIKAMDDVNSWENPTFPSPGSKASKKESEIIEKVFHREY